MWTAVTDEAGALHRRLHLAAATHAALIGGVPREGDGVSALDSEDVGVSAQLGSEPAPGGRAHCRRPPSRSERDPDAGPRTVLMPQCPN